MKYQPLTPDHFFHIYNCGNNKENIFKEEKNYGYFLKLISKHIIPVAEIYAYCLLKNHFHLIVKTKNAITDKTISQAFSNLFNAYSKAINKTYNRSGSLFRDRFSRKIIQDKSYLKQLILYVHLNPEHHGFTANFETYRHSSYFSIIAENPTFIERNSVVALFEDIENFKYAHRLRKTEKEEKFKEYILE